MSSAALNIRASEGSPTNTPVPIGESVVGRSSAAVIRIVDDTVSGEHARIRWDGEHLLIRDNGSTNGTRLHGSPLTDWMEVSHGDRIRLGAVDVEVQIDGVSPAVVDPHTVEMDTDPTLGAALRAAGSVRRTVFLSYAREDTRWADWLARWLQARGWSVWVDKESIRGGARWAGEIERAIGSSSLVLLLLSSNSVVSDWVNSELAAAKDLRVPVVAADLDDPPLPKSMQFLLRDRQRVPIRMEEGRPSQQSLAGIDEALIGTLEQAHGSNPDALKLGLGTLLLTIGLLGFILAFASFFYLAFVLSSGAPGAGFDPIPSEVPILGGMAEPQGFFAVFGFAFASMIVAGIGQALRRSARLKGVTWDMRRR
jgi:predicted component of type VI protein secretion system